MNGLLQEILNASTLLLPAVAVPNEVHQREDWNAKIARWQDQLTRTLQSLESEDRRLGNPWMPRRLPRDQAYRERQRVNGRRAELASSIRLAQDVAVRLRELLDRYGTPTKAEQLEAFKKLVDDHVSTYEELREVESMLSGPVFRPDSPDPLGAFKVVLVLAHILLHKRLARRTGNAKS